MTYRSEIDVLRALAVILVILFHGQISFFPGGFIGVDVFFVISGFLITNIITSQLESGSFSLAKFFASRARRIVPALIVMVFVVASICYLLSLYSYNDFKSFRHSMRSALLFYSNIYFYLKTGYFDAPAIRNVFLHTWSLGVEAQFYFIYPFLLRFAYKRWRVCLSNLLLGSAVTLFVLSSIFVHFYPDTGFYLFPFRAWELFLGGWLAVSGFSPENQTTKKYCIAVGGILICCSAMIFNNVMTVYTPGVWALFPCVGAALIIIGSDSFDQRGVIYSLIHNNALIYLGLISYSLYLWHWPVFVMYRLISLDQQISLISFVLLLIPTFALAHYSWKYIEQPARKKFVQWDLKRQVAAFVVCLSLTLLPAKFITQPHTAWGNTSYAQGSTDRCSIDNYSLLGKGETTPQFLVLGDSHAEAAGNLFDDLGKKAGLTGRLIYGDGLINGRRRRATNYDQANEKIKKYISEEKYPTVFIVNRWALGIKGYLPAEHFRPGLDHLGYIYTKEDKVLVETEAIEATLADTVDFLETNGARNIFILSPVPECGIEIPRAASTTSFFARDDNAINERLGVPLADYRQRNEEVFSILQRIERKFDSVVLIDVSSVFFEGNRNKSIVVKDGKSLYYDDDHLSQTGARILTPLLAQYAPFNPEYK